MKKLLIVAAFALLLGLAACFADKKADIIKKSEGVSDKAGLEKALGTPDTINKTGPIEQWIYKADDGQVVFTILGDTIALEHTNQ